MTLTVPLIVGLVEGEAEILAVLHIVFVTLPVLVTDMVRLTELEVHPDTVPVEQKLGVFVTERVPVWHTLSVGVVVMDDDKDGVRVLDPHVVIDPELLKESVTVEDKHKVGEVLTELVVKEDPVRVPELQGEGVIVDEEQ